MKYEILIEGGFTGIPKEYKGDVDIEKETKNVLVDLFGRTAAAQNENLRDGLQYRLKLIDGREEHHALFDESNLPLPIRQFIDTIAKRQQEKKN